MELKADGFVSGFAMGSGGFILAWLLGGVGCLLLPRIWAADCWNIGGLFEFEAVPMAELIENPSERCGFASDTPLMLGAAFDCVVSG